MPEKLIIVENTFITIQVFYRYCPYLYPMKSKQKKSRFVNSLITNTIIVFGTLIILWKVDFTPGSPDAKTSLKDSVKEEYHPFSNNVKGSDGEIIKHTYFTFSYNELYEQPDWVAYMLTPEMLSGYAKRKSRFINDPLVKTGSASHDDYTNTGFDRGHLMPAATCDFDQNAKDETFYASNISPQVPGFNRGIWKQIEKTVRDWTNQYGHLYVVTGPAIFIPDSVIGENEVGVPASFYKVVLHKEGSKYSTAAFLLKNEKSNLEPFDFLVPVDSVENITGLDFFWELQDSIEETTERTVSGKFLPTSAK